MNILIMNLSYNGGGAEAVARQTYKISEYHSDINTYFLAGRGRLFQGYDCIYPRRTPQKYINLYLCDKAHNQRLHDGYALKKIKSLIRKYKIDILHIHNLHGGYIGIDDIKELAKEVKVVWTLHDMWAVTGHCAHNFGCMNYLTDGCLKCDRLSAYAPITADIAGQCFKHKVDSFTENGISFVTPSHWLKDVCQQGILKNENITVIENGVNTRLFAPATPEDRSRKLTELGLDVNKIALFFVAHELTSEFKGADVLIDALNQIEDKSRFSLIICGKGEALNIPEGYDSCYTGYISDPSVMAQYYGIADAFILPSRAENFPCTTVEALSCGTPVIASNAGGIPEQVTKETGYIFENGDAKALADILERVSKDDLNQMRDACRIRAIELYSEERMLSRYRDIYENITDSK